MIKIIDKYLEFKIKFEPYDGRAEVSLFEVVKYEGAKFHHSELVKTEYFKLLNWLGVPKTEGAIRAGMNTLKREMLTRYLRNSRLTVPLERFIYDETEGKYYVRHGATESFIERLRGK